MRCLVDKKIKPDVGHLVRFAHYDDSWAPQLDKLGIIIDKRGISCLLLYRNSVSWIRRDQLDVVSY